ncbi:hypothetical protein CS022_09955 [Veronia nyctiphanis]|uniref:Uncharacterized protein n=1 Tax=Veronia nyctiphanis TaxID=1278244 RepID=A0A4V1LSY4_9GAMM|nr:hypothetical protein CS022_09955 [Veronia nyctiphanis]
MVLRDTCQFFTIEKAPGADTKPNKLVEHWLISLISKVLLPKKSRKTDLKCLFRIANTHIHKFVEKPSPDRHE